jgi:hypothetical protein
VGVVGGAAGCAGPIYRRLKAVGGGGR